MVSICFFMIIVFLLCVVVVELGMGVNWGMVVLYSLLLEIVLDFLKDNKIEKVKFFDVDFDVFKVLMGSGIEVMVGILNEILVVFSLFVFVVDLWVF